MKLVSALERAGTGLEYLQRIVSGEYGTVPIGDRVATSEAKLMDCEGKLLAHGTTTCLIPPRK